MSEGQRGLGTKVPLKESKFEYYPGLRSNRFADIASLSLAMTRLLLKAPQAHNVSQLP